MSHHVFKYELTLGTNLVELPQGAQVLSAMVQHHRLHMWAIVDSTIGAATSVRFFEVYGTGAPINEPEKLVHLATVPAESGRFIWHVFERQA